MRAAFTIIYNGLHHLEHKNFAVNMAKAFDYWIVVDGLSSNGGSTSWCNRIKQSKQSTDGTIEFMEQFSKLHLNVIFHTSPHGFRSKDAQVNKCVELLRTKTNKCTLFQVDVDEVWTLQAIDQAERELIDDPSVAGAISFNHYVGKLSSGEYLIARGDWGSSHMDRLWNWEGQRFLTHEPPRVRGQKSSRLLTPKFDHYSYMFRKDVEMKSKYYKDHGHILPNWDRIQEMNASQFPIPVEMLLGKIKNINHQNSYIHAI